VSSSGNAPEAFPRRTSPPRRPSGAGLTGTRTSVYDCRGEDPDFATCSCDRSSDPDCTAHLATADSDGHFLAEPDLTLLRVDDPFAEQSAYFHVDAHSSFLDALDLAGFGARTPAAASGSSPRW
jgi:hypothetical protein